MRTRTRMVAVLVAVSLLASACAAFVGRMYEWGISGLTVRVVVFEVPTYQMATVYVATNRDPWRTGDILRNINLEKDYGQAEWRDLHTYHQQDVADQLEMIIGAAHIDAYDCFGMNKDLYPPFNLDAVKVNAPQDPRCRWGEAFK